MKLNTGKNLKVRFLLMENYGELLAISLCRQDRVVIQNVDGLTVNVIPFKEIDR